MVLWVTLGSAEISARCSLYSCACLPHWFTHSVYKKPEYIPLVGSTGACLAVILLVELADITDRISKLYDHKQTKSWISICAPIICILFLALFIIFFILTYYFKPDGQVDIQKIIWTPFVFLLCLAALAPCFSILLTSPTARQASTAILAFIYTILLGATVQESIQEQKDGNRFFQTIAIAALIIQLIAATISTITEFEYRNTGHTEATKDEKEERNKHLEWFEDTLPYQIAGIVFCLLLWFIVFDNPVSSQTCPAQEKPIASEAVNSLFTALFTIVTLEYGNLVWKGYKFKGHKTSTVEQRKSDGTEMNRLVTPTTKENGDR